MQQQQSQSQRQSQSQSKHEQEVQQKRQQQQHHHQPARRIRREWRALSDESRTRVADAMWAMKEVPTEEGRDRYGPRYISIDDLTMLHACSTYDRRCDQGHYGPHFATFHRAFLLKYENSLLAVDPSIGAMPYWDVFRDAADGGDCYENDDCYIFTDRYFGSIAGDPRENYAVTDGLFAYWPVPAYRRSKFGRDSDWNVDCYREEWFEEQEGLSSPCDTKYVRGIGSCEPYVVRDPSRVPRIQGSRELRGSRDDFDACTDGENIRSAVDWENCVQLEQLSCSFAMSGMTCQEGIQMFRNEIPSGGRYDFFRDAIGDLDGACGECDLRGFYYDRSGRKRRPMSLHPQVHMLLGGDLFSGSTSPNDAGVFVSHHANVDRSHMTWMANTLDDLADEYWRFPARQSDGDRLSNPDHMNGPYAMADVLGCPSRLFPEYAKFGQPWKDGTLLDDVVNPGFPFDDLWDTPPENGWGYTHREILYHSDPRRTIYTYDTLAEYYDYSTASPTFAPTESPSGTPTVPIQTKTPTHALMAEIGNATATPQYPDTNNDINNSNTARWPSTDGTNDLADDDSEIGNVGVGKVDYTTNGSNNTQDAESIDSSFALTNKTATTAAAESLTSTQGNQANAGLISGLSVAAVVIAAALASLLVLSYRRRSKQSHNRHHPANVEKGDVADGTDDPDRYENEFGTDPSKNALTLRLGQQRSPSTAKTLSPNSENEGGIAPTVFYRPSPRSSPSRCVLRANDGRNGVCANDGKEYAVAAKRDCEVPSQLHPVKGSKIDAASGNASTKDGTSSVVVARQPTISEHAQGPVFTSLTAMLESVSTSLDTETLCGAGGTETCATRNAYLSL